MTVLDPEQLAARRLRVIDKAKLLVCTPDAATAAGVPTLLVDGHALMTNENDVRYWSLRYCGDGIWRHGPADSEGPLFVCLYSIAAAYDLNADPPLVEALPGSSPPGSP